MKSGRLAALRWLARREYSSHELIDRLVRMGLNSEHASALVAELANQDLQSDERFVEVFVRSRRERLYGPGYIRNALRERGISAVLARAATNPDDAFWWQAAEDCRRRRFGTAAAQDRKQWLKESRYLSNRGFTAEQINAVIGQLPD